MGGVLKSGWTGRGRLMRRKLYYYPTERAAVGRVVIDYTHSEYKRRWVAKVEGLDIEGAIALLKSQTGESEGDEWARQELLSAIERLRERLRSPSERKRGERKEKKVTVRDDYDVPNYVWAAIERNCDCYAFYETRVWICKRSIVIWDYGRDLVVFAPRSALRRGDIPERALPSFAKLKDHLDELPPDVVDLLRVAVFASVL